MEEVKTVAIGDTESIMLFNAIGVATAAAEPETAAGELLARVNDGYSIIFITEKCAAAAQELIERYKAQPYPIILPIPDRNGSDGSGLRAITANMEKAIGTNIFDKE